MNRLLSQVKRAEKEIVERERAWWDGFCLMAPLQKVEALKERRAFIQAMFRTRSREAMVDGFVRSGWNADKAGLFADWLIEDGISSMSFMARLNRVERHPELERRLQAAVAAMSDEELVARIVALSPGEFARFAGMTQEQIGAQLRQDGMDERAARLWAGAIAGEGRV